MSVNALKWAFDIEIKDPTAKLVLLSLSDHYSDLEGCAWPSMKRLARRTGADERTIQRAINRLIEMGHVLRETRDGRSSFFHLNLPIEDRDQNPRQSDAPGNTPSAKVTGRGGRKSANPRQSDGHNSYRTPIEPSDIKLASRKEWEVRLAGYRPMLGKRNWKPAWGPRPDSVGGGHIAPKDLLTKWRAGEVQRVARVS